MFLEELDFFKEGYKILEESEDYYKVKKNNRIYLVEKISHEEYSDYRIEKFFKEEMGEFFPEIISFVELGKVRDQLYIIKEEPINFLDKFSLEEQLRAGNLFGKGLKKYHDKYLDLDSSNWQKIYQDRIYQLQHGYFLGDYRGIYDYIFLDYLNEHSYLLENRPTTRILNLDFLSELVVTKDFRFSFPKIQATQMADPFYEFKCINLHTKGREHFLKGILEGYFGGEIPRLFFRILILYTIVEFWGKDFLWEEFWSRKNKTKDIIPNCQDNRARKIVQIYDDFSDIVPQWLRKIENEI